MEPGSGRLVAALKRIFLWKLRPAFVTTTCCTHEFVCPLILGTRLLKTLWILGLAVSIISTIKGFSTTIIGWLTVGLEHILINLRFAHSNNSKNYM